jgi:hypothetical protein
MVIDIDWLVMISDSVHVMSIQSTTTTTRELFWMMLDNGGDWVMMTTTLSNDNVASVGFDCSYYYVERHRS